MSIKLMFIKYKSQSHINMGSYMPELLNSHHSGIAILKQSLSSALLEAEKNKEHAF